MLGNASFSLELEMALADLRPDRMTKGEAALSTILERRNKYPRGSVVLFAVVGREKEKHSDAANK